MMFLKAITYSCFAWSFVKHVSDASTHAWCLYDSLRPDFGGFGGGAPNVATL